MTYFDWEDRYDLGIDAMNGEHQLLIGLMNRLYELNRDNAPHAKLREVLDELEAFTIVHFKHEEQYQASIHYPGLDSHRRIHEQLLARLSDHKREFVAAKSGVSNKLFGFLKLWLSAHIAGIDQKYAEHAHGHAKSAS